MAFLASMTTGAVLLVRASAAEWQSDVASEVTIQVRPAQGRDLERDVRTVVETVRATPGILDVRPFTARRSPARLLEPWLGTGLSLDDLPVPRMIVARVAPGNRSISRHCAAARDAGGADRPPSTTTAPGSNACAR